MTNYTFGKIYRLYNNNTTDTYIGSTAQKNVRKRFSRHKEEALTKNRMERYGEIWKGPESPRIEVIEEYPCDTRRELLLRERYWIEVLKGCNILNKNLPICYDDVERKKRIREQQKKYFQTEKGKKMKRKANERASIRRKLKKLNQELSLI
jgi:hypothetical protein